MKELTPSKEEQIEALIHDKAYQLTIRYSGRDKSGRPNYRKVFNVTRKDIERPLKNHYKFDDLPFVSCSIGPKDGFYIIPTSKAYTIYKQERGVHTRDKTVKSASEARKLYIDWILDTSGTGLEWK